MKYMYEVKLFTVYVGSECVPSNEDKINTFLRRAQGQSKNFEVVSITSTQSGDYITYLILYKR